MACEMSAAKGEVDACTAVCYCRQMPGRAEGAAASGFGIGVGGMAGRMNGKRHGMGIHPGIRGCMGSWCGPVLR